MINNEELAAIMSIPPGPWTKHAVDFLTTWELAHPTRHDKAAIIEALQSNKGEEVVSRLVTHLLESTVHPFFSATKGFEPVHLT